VQGALSSPSRATLYDVLANGTSYGQRSFINVENISSYQSTTTRSNHVKAGANLGLGRLGSCLGR